MSILEKLLRLQKVFPTSVLVVPVGWARRIRDMFIQTQRAGGRSTAGPCLGQDFILQSNECCATLNGAHFLYLMKKVNCHHIDMVWKYWNVFVHGQFLHLHFGPQYLLYNILKCLKCDFSFLICCSFLRYFFVFEIRKWVLDHFNFRFIDDVRIVGLNPSIVTYEKLIFFLGNEKTFYSRFCSPLLLCL